MFRKFYPKRYMNSTYEIDFEKFYNKGYRGILFDIDNTLVAHGVKADERAKALFTRLKSIGYQCCLISNNKEPRVKSFHEEVQVPYVFNAHKPARSGYERGMELCEADVSNTLFVGDQLFTDVYGANRLGIYTILVKPIHPKEEIQIVLKRHLEKIVLHFYKKDKERKRNERKN